MWKRWLVFLKWSQHTVQKWTDVPWRLVLLPSLSCSLLCRAAHLSEAGKPPPSQWRPPTPGRCSGCAPCSIGLHGLLLSWAFFIHLLCFLFFFLIAIIKRYNKQLFTDTWMVPVPAQDILIIPRPGDSMVTLLWMGIGESGSFFSQCLLLEALYTSPPPWTTKLETYWPHVWKKMFPG